MQASQAMVRNGGGRAKHEHGSEEGAKRSSVKKKASRRRRTPAERAKEKNEAIFWAFVEAQGKCEAAWARIDKLAASTEPHEEEFEESEEERDFDGAEWHCAFLEWQSALEEGETDLAFDDWARAGREEEQHEDRD